MLNIKLDRHEHQDAGCGQFIVAAGIIATCLLLAIAAAAIAHL